MFMAFDNSAIHPGRQSEIVGIDDQAAQAASLPCLRLVIAIRDAAARREKLHIGTADCWLRC
jgi:hypothetical protein